jgi:hypothetical protein
MSISASATDFLSRYIIGIDLGTTNCSVHFVDGEAPEPRIQPFPILQLIAPGELSSEALLPSFCYLPGDSELPAQALDLPWGKNPALAVGRFAREQGARLPERLIFSAKSWLAHAGVERLKPILPWGSELGKQMRSPVQAASAYLQHIGHAWDQRFGRQRDRDGNACVIAEQQIVLTVPASFDESARELTLRAARDAGMKQLTLIEEPLAAFYAWLDAHPHNWQEQLRPGDAVLVMDIGGGTSDFTLLRVEKDAVIRRHAVGEHLLLGGDNMDIALARQAEAAWRSRLPQRQWAMLCQECRRAKEILFAEDSPEQASVQLAAPGSSILAGMKSHSFQREELRELINEGFFPALPLDSAAPERRQGIQELGLPYAADAAITRQLLHFLKHAGQESGQMAHPSHILFNGGAMTPRALRQRVCSIVGSWQGRDTLPELDSASLNLAVSQGAAYYGMVRRGQGIRVKGGIARAYYLQVEEQGQAQLICVMPRDTNEGQLRRLAEPVFQLRANQPVSFPLFASATRLHDQLGDRIVEPSEITALPPLQAVMQYGKGMEHTLLSVVLSACLNEVGTLDLWCEAVASKHRFPLAFDLRDSRDASASAQEHSNKTAAQGITVSEDAIAEAMRELQSAFNGTTDALNALSKAMERALALPRADWNAALCRRMVDELLRKRAWRDSSPQHEARWLNLLGFCLRPGFGVAGDDWRIRECWKLWLQGLSAAKNAQCQIDWWICWRRIAPGLRSGQQEQLAAAITRVVVNKDEKNAVGRNQPLGLEQWRCLAALEHLSAASKLRLLRVLLLNSGRWAETFFWIVARLAARRPFHGPQNSVVPAAKWEPLLAELLDRAHRDNGCRPALFAIASSCRLTGIRSIDLSDAVRAKATAFLSKHQAPAAWLAMLTDLQSQHDASRAFQSELMGDELPLGLVLDQPDDEHPAQA